jgi:hypothetical protein
VDFTVESILERLLFLILKATGAPSVPFIWFWPEGAPACAIMTHDVEARPGMDSCSSLMDIDDAFGVKSSFQIVPEGRYPVRQSFLQRFRQRGFEINVHDLNHDGHLFDSRREFLERAARINWYAREFNSRGFRSGAMYRNQQWYDALDVSYDMSVPNVAHLEPQHGGCCTAMPYFVGDIVELPLTTTQDYSLFHILGDYTTTLWKRQIQLLMDRNGLISFGTHPDYLMESQAQAVYRELLGYLSRLRAEKALWITLPGELERWWRNRQQMQLVRNNGDWRVEGPDSERARVAHACIREGQLVYAIE